MVDVHKRAYDQHKHASPETYKKVTSKVAGNMSSQKEAKLRRQQVTKNQAYDHDMVDRLLSGSPSRETTYIAGNATHDHSSTYIVGMP